MNLHEDVYGSTTFPLYQTATFDVTKDSYDYTRSGNPNRVMLENELSKLYNTKHSLAFSSGMAALLCLTKLVKPGQRIICTTNTYGGTFRLLNSLKEFGILIEFIDIFVDETGNTNIEHITTLLEDKKTKMIIIESLSNPFLKFCDVKLISSIIKRNNSDCIFAVDNSFLSPILCNPIELGVDIVMESLTKFANGSGDCMGGILTTNNKEIHKDLYFYSNAYGLALNPYNCWLIQRNIPTMSLRVNKQQINCISVYKFLKSCDWVEKVYYPFEFNDKEIGIYNKVSKGPGSILTFSTDHAEDIFNNVKVFQRTVSFGSIFSKIELPYKMSHFCVSQEDSTIIPKNLVRLSIGLEEPDILIEDLLRFKTD